ncbi:pachytene checkpoint protein 2 homolog isoform X1 [Tursiops truncatus]|uniref:Pachytene checkpoint protein 2 homolog n=1 Tax=Tursiops truncatus TaxID=9739 RepID=A0A6J3R1R8_TURTR|nr:pachytene checkpoint protein 2 homolog isoform X1 [Tursiops truncatus]
MWRSTSGAAAVGLPVSANHSPVTAAALCGLHVGPRVIQHSSSVVTDLQEPRVAPTLAVAPSDGDLGHRALGRLPQVTRSLRSTAKREDLKLSVRKLLTRHNIVFGDYTWTEFDEPFLARNVQSVSIVDTELQTKGPQPVDLSMCTIALHIFQLNEDGPSSENLEEETENIVAANHWVLPAAEFHGLWDSLVYDVEIKSHLLDYVMTTLLFSDKNVDSTLITWNRVVLLHGPPGTGKTSLCKALAQKLTIRLSSRYRYGQLIEINSHSLFSKWFSESGKLVTRMFQKIQDLIDDKDALVFVLIDEVESLTASRNACRAGAEPSDAIRVVNAVLTQIDQIKRHSNVVILTTSNITERIDVAFVDRADIRQYIGPPSAAAIFRIYLSCLEELMRCQIVYPRQQLLTLRELEMIGFIENNVSKLSLLLSEISRKSEGLSGRVLRKLPFLAHALYVQAPTITVEGFLQALSLAVDKQFEDRKKLSSCV